MILDPKQTGMLREVIAEGEYYGMQTFDQHLLRHLRAGRISYEESIRVATAPHDFKLMVAAETRDGGLPAETLAAIQAAQAAAAAANGSGDGAHESAGEVIASAVPPHAAPPAPAAPAGSAPPVPPAPYMPSAPPAPQVIPSLDGGNSSSAPPPGF
jgi:twitching motility protein PilT